MCELQEQNLTLTNYYNKYILSSLSTYKSHQFTVSHIFISLVLKNLRGMDVVGL